MTKIISVFCLLFSIIAFSMDFLFNAREAIHKGLDTVEINDCRYQSQQALNFLKFGTYSNKIVEDHLKQASSSKSIKKCHQYLKTCIGLI
jgi:hypothetical protein